jgi:hypothetical protein
LKIGMLKKSLTLKLTHTLRYSPNMLKPYNFKAEIEPSYFSQIIECCSEGQRPCMPM